jgi:hypothetical protein
MPKERPDGSTIKRVFISGAQGMGTSTAQRKIAKHWRFTPIPDSVRAVQEEMGQHMDVITGDVQLNNLFQTRCTQKGLFNEMAAQKPYVIDQGPIDNLAYSLQFTTIGFELFSQPMVQEYIKGLDNNDVRIIFLTAQENLLKDDGFRPARDLSWGAVKQTQGALLALYAMCGLNDRISFVDTGDANNRIKRYIEILGEPRVPINFDDVWEEALDFLPKRDAFNGRAKAESLESSYTNSSPVA